MRRVEIVSKAKADGPLDNETTAALFIGQRSKYFLQTENHSESLPGTVL